MAPIVLREIVSNVYFSWRVSLIRSLSLVKSKTLEDMHTSRRDGKAHLWPTGGMIGRPDEFRRRQWCVVEADLWCWDKHREVYRHCSLFIGLSALLEQDRQFICFWIGETLSDRY